MKGVLLNGFIIKVESEIYSGVGLVKQNIIWGGTYNEKHN
ncbi:hypothetical protein LD11_gp226 [Bacillus phage Riley]|uniref:Uncharacterized protein n=3 Tax=Bequatrovirus TaxID=1917990 RepID=A0A075LZZ1_9CAUD|nr:hypothetical protein LD11_gp226 [Bacillus phage Riley]YP_009206585.1 hypothetical protein AVV02_gp230 [Bacillus phage AvesoBmore]ASZ75956.1 hypothetical protein TAFFO16_223 [Bacillus phage Taffo16]ULF48850.1 hypothetical protein [Bacillus phage BillyBob]AIF72102.1 hypothetical protein [Bacillus phage Riley]ALA13389.1 hypothetical protein AVESOBMORE_230 [Bacillus phage AvesoBmore]